MMTSMRGTGSKCCKTRKPGAITCRGSWRWGQGAESDSWKRRCGKENI